MDELRRACAEVASRARHVRIDTDRIAAYAAALPEGPPPAPEDDELTGDRETVAAFWLTLDAINFGSGWFPTLRKTPGRSGYYTIAGAVRRRFAQAGPWEAAALAEITPAELGATLDQDPAHPLMALFAASLRDLGSHLARGEYQGSFARLAGSTGGSVVALARRLGTWACFADCSRYEELELPFLKRAQIAAADLARAGVISAPDLGRLTMFADNLVPHVLRLDGILRVDPELVARIESGQLLAPGSPEEVELRACALRAVELIVAAGSGRCAAEVDQLLWLRGQGPHYKRVPRHRCRCTAY